jgi:hypothetical protein
MERILCAAIWYKDYPAPFHNVKNINNKGLVLCGYRHGYIIGQCISLLNKSQYQMGEHVQGFLTSDNRFLNRQEALELHLKNGGKSEFSDELYSEDLY